MFGIVINLKGQDQSCKMDLDVWDCQQSKTDQYLSCKMDLDLNGIVINLKDQDRSCKMDQDLWDYQLPQR